ncbi:hypothetical protein [Blastococcus deserti]|uniref:Uncharacterized protein n=1 Tax=Blastococcus deserti TaxID=2259033 RepID=A0ABW4XBF7_9ACTN
MRSTERRGEHPHVDVVRKCFSFGFWLLAAGAAATLGLDLEADVLP